MVETITYARVLREDLDLGVGERTIRLQDGSLHTLEQIAGEVSIQDTVSTPATADQIQLSVTFSNPAGAKIHGATVKVLSNLGTSNGLTSFDVGDSILSDRWASAVAITANTETTSNDFSDADEPIVGANYQVLLTQNGGNFDGTGEIEVQLRYSVIQHL